MEGLCNSIYGNTEDRSNPSQYKYSYEKKIYDAALIDFSNDTDSSARQKIRSLWNSHQYRFHCNAFNFQVMNGSILKYAIEMRHFDILDSALKSWHVDLNWVDTNDHQTVMDFMDVKLESNQGTSFETILLAYARELKEGGAKRASEIPSFERDRQVADCRQQAKNAGARDTC